MRNAKLAMLRAQKILPIQGGIAVVPGSPGREAGAENTVLQEVRNGALAAVEIAKPEMWRPLGIVFKRNRARSPAQKEFIAMLKKTAPGDGAASLRV